MYSTQFINLHILNSNKVLIYFQKNKIHYNFPNYIGFMILEISRKINYMMYYEVLLPIFKNYSPSLIYSDTDSFTISYILNLTLLFVMKKIFLSRKISSWKNYDAGYLDSSNYNKDHPFHKTPIYFCHVFFQQDSFLL